jgi:hypothetical protein
VRLYDFLQNITRTTVHGNLRTNGFSIIRKTAADLHRDAVVVGRWMETSPGRSGGRSKWSRRPACRLLRQLYGSGASVATPRKGDYVRSEECDGVRNSGPAGDRIRNHTPEDIARVSFDCGSYVSRSLSFHWEECVDSSENASVKRIGMDQLRQTLLTWLRWRVLRRRSALCIK